MTWRSRQSTSNPASHPEERPLRRVDEALRSLQGIQQGARAPAADHHLGARREVLQGALVAQLGRLSEDRLVELRSGGLRLGRLLGPLAVRPRRALRRLILLGHPGLFGLGCGLGCCGRPATLLCALRGLTLFGLRGLLLRLRRLALLLLGLLGLLNLGKLCRGLPSLLLLHLGLLGLLNLGKLCR